MSVPNMPLDPSAPNSLEAEEAVIGSVLIDPSTYDTLSTFLTPNSFFLLRHNYVWSAFERLDERGDAIDPITVVEELENMGVLDQIGGRAYLTQVTMRVGTSVNAEVYGRLVERTAVRRNLMDAADNVKEIAKDESINIDRVIEKTYGELDFITARHAKDDPVTLYDALNEFFYVLDAEYQAKLNNDPVSYGIPTGFRDVDVILGGFKKEQVITLGGRPGMGKTSAALSIMSNMLRIGMRLFFLSLEMSIMALVERMLSIEAGVNLQRLKNREMSQQEFNRVLEAMGRMSKWNLVIWRTGRATPKMLESKVRKQVATTGLDGVFVDYLQLMTAPGFGNNKVQEISYISRSLKQDIATDFKLFVFQNAQLSRSVEQRADKRPILADLRESGQIEQDSDIVAFLYRDEVYNEATEFPNQADFIIAKHRDGPTGTVALYFEKTLTKFMNASVHRVDLSDIE